MGLEVLFEKVQRFESTWLQKRVKDILLNKKENEKTRLSMANDKIKWWVIGVLILRIFLSLITLGLVGIIYKKITSKSWFIFQHTQIGREDILARSVNTPVKFESEKSNIDEIHLRNVTEIKSDTYTTITRAVMIDAKGEHDVTVITQKDLEDKTEMLALSIREEAEILRTLDHQNIVRIIHTGTFEHHTFGLVLECADHGTLSDFIMAGPIFQNMQWYEGKANRISLAMNVVRGLNYLHETANMVHRNLNSSSISVFSNNDGTYAAKISDCSSVISLDEDVRAKPFEISNWTAPEYMCLKYNPKKAQWYSYPTYDNKNYPLYPKGFDIWSFGLLLWQMSTREEPFLEFKLKSKQQGYEPLLDHLIKYGHSGESLYNFKALKRPNCPFGVDKLIAFCLWTENPCRPSTKRIIEIEREQIRHSRHFLVGRCTEENYVAWDEKNERLGPALNIFPQ